MASREIPSSSLVPPTDSAANHDSAAVAATAAATSTATAQASVAAAAAVVSSWPSHHGEGHDHDRATHGMSHVRGEAAVAPEASASSSSIMSSSSSLSRRSSLASVLSYGGTTVNEDEEEEQQEKKTNGSNGKELTENLRRAEVDLEVDPSTSKHPSYVNFGQPRMGNALTDQDFLDRFDDALPNDPRMKPKSPEQIRARQERDKARAWKEKLAKAGCPDHMFDTLPQDVTLILKLMPHKTQEEVERRLSAHVEKQARVQIVLNELLETIEDTPGEPLQEKNATLEDPVQLYRSRSPSPLPGRKNKSGNGLKSKNRDKFPVAGREAGGSSNEPSTSAAAKRPHIPVDIEAPPVKKAKDEGSEGVAVNPIKREDRPKIQLSEDHLHGPFDFKAHRPGPRNTKKIVGEQLQDDVKVLLPPMTKPVKTPEVVDLQSDIRLPELVDLSQIDHKEKEDLLNQLRTMFPETPCKYLEEKVPELAGRPVATEKFIDDLLANNSQPPDEWFIVEEAMELEQGDTVHFNNITVNLDEPQPGPSTELGEEDEVDKKYVLLQDMFPDTDPEFLHTKAEELVHNEAEFCKFVEEGVESKGKEFPTRAEYEKKKKTLELSEKYSREVTVQDILEMYDDPEAYFSDTSRAVSETYKLHSVAHLKKQFRNLSATVIAKHLSENNGLYFPTFRALTKVKGVRSLRRKTRRADHECLPPQEIDINFLKELQFSRIEHRVKEFQENLKQEREQKIQEQKQLGILRTCDICCNDECLESDMLQCKGGHEVCKECVIKSSEIAIGEGKTSLDCLNGCGETFELAVLQRALRPNMFSKWLKKIQIAEVQEADVEGLVKCPFCEFATIMETSAEENKVFQCQNPDCGKESCRLCGELSHIPYRCDEVEHDKEVRKRTFIENKMSEALIRKCWKCKKPFLKTDGCNKMTCQCGAQMCYLCRQPVTGYDHFYGQGTRPSANRKCALFSDDQKIHNNDIARGAREAKREMDAQDPNVRLLHDPTEGLEGMDEDMEGDNHDVDDMFNGDDRERNRIIREQRHIEAAIRQQQRALRHPYLPPPIPPMPPIPIYPFMGDPMIRNPPEYPPQDFEFAQRMGELLQLRNAQRQQHRVLRRREQEVLDDLHTRMGHRQRGPDRPGLGREALAPQEQQQRRNGVRFEYVPPPVPIQFQDPPQGPRPINRTPVHPLPAAGAFNINHGQAAAPINHGGINPFAPPPAHQQIPPPAHQQIPMPGPIMPPQPPHAHQQEE